MIIERDRVRLLLVKIYGEEVGASLASRLDSLLTKYRSLIPRPHRTGLDQRDAVLITYPDQVQAPDRAPLQTLTNFCARHLKGLISAVHVLPFYPWSSDDGFSVMDFRSVAAQYGSWANLQELGKDFRLMFDAVINHASTQGEWFRNFLSGDPSFRNYFIEVSRNPDLSRVFRPRALPLLTKFNAASGEKSIWTTFGADQADLNYRNPEVLLSVIDILSFYVSQGAEFIRLDAIAYLWKEIGTACIHLPRTHEVVQLFRAVLDEIAPQVMLITETNVPHAENISYFGDGANEAQMVYNFSLPPLVLHTFLTGNAEALSAWASSLELPSDKVTFFNFLASHDGIGVGPLRGILPEAEIEMVVRGVESRGGLVSYKHNPDGTQSAYELNINYFDALDRQDVSETLEIKVDRFIAAHAILLAFAGVPAIYFHSMFGSRGWPEGVVLTGQNRTINRQKLKLAELEYELSATDGLRSQVFQRLSYLLKIRREYAAFDPYSQQSILDVGKGVFALLRFTEKENGGVLCLQNVTGVSQSLKLDLSQTKIASSEMLRDLVSNEIIEKENPLSISMQPYQVIWLLGER